MRFFNTAGPVDERKHYCLSPLHRFDLPAILSLIDQEKYFILHAPRQTGKTSCLLALMRYLNEQERYRCLYCNVEAAQAARENVPEAMRAILAEVASAALNQLGDEFPDRRRRHILEESGGYAALGRLLSEWSAASEKRLVLLLDEIDALVGDTLISVLRQLRAGYTHRPAYFPQTVVMCGVRDIRDYRIHSALGKEIITGGSAFNVKAESLRLGNFVRSEVEALLQQHTEETGQRFEAEAVDRIWDYSRGQPWLVNALAYETCFKMPEGRNRAQPITAEMVEQARERLIERRETHLDQLVDKLKEERVRRVVGPILAGETDPRLIPPDDVQYVADLGIITTEGQLAIANPIYREIIPRELTWSTQLTISHQPQWYIRPDGRLDLDKLLAAFQEFFREHSESWIERFDYREAGPQLLMQAFLQRIVNGGGRVEREYGLGRMRTDLLIVWPVKPGGAAAALANDFPKVTSPAASGQTDFPRSRHPVQKAVIELKILYKSLEKTIADGLAQTWAYMDRCGAEEAHLVIFDRRPEPSWEEKLFRREESWRGRSITVWGM